MIVQRQRGRSLEHSIVGEILVQTHKYRHSSRDLIFMSMTINEAVKITREEHLALTQLESRIYSQITKFLENRGAYLNQYDIGKLLEWLNTSFVGNYSNTSVVKLYMHFIWERDKDADASFHSAYKQEIPDTFIVFNMAKILHQRDDSNKFYCRRDELMPLLIHEYVHFLQFVGAIKNRNMKLMTGNIRGLAKVNPFPHTKSYMHRPHEQAAWGHGFIERLKRFGSNPNSIIRYLKSYGVDGKDELQRLKKRDYAGWKKLMKSAISAAHTEFRTTLPPDGDG